MHLFIKRGAEINVINHKGETPVLNADRIGKQGHIAILAREKANLDQRDDNGKFPLLLASENGHTNAIEELITNGASLKVTNEQRYNCLERAINSRKIVQLPCVFDSTRVKILLTNIKKNTKSQ